MSRVPVILVVITMSFASCDGGEIVLVQPDDAMAPAVQFEVRVLAEDSALAGAMGWEEGVPGAGAEWAFVHYQRFIFHSAVSDGTGVIRLDTQDRGWHWISARAEVELDGVPRVLGGGAKAEGSTELWLRLDEPGTLVISEIYMDSPPPWEAGSYYASKYIELYNNSAEVRYLDGMILGKAYDYARDSSANGHHSCAFTAPFREDSNAVWSRSHWRFPGNGTEHPVAPGEAVTVAVGAADHTAVHPTMLNLSDARFEFGAPGQADNPAAPNLANVSSDYVGFTEFLEAFWFLSGPLELSDLETMTDDDYLYGSSSEYRGFPASAIIDVAIMQYDFTSSYLQFRSPPCRHPIHPRFDALPGGYLAGSEHPEDLLVASQRRVVRMDGGRAILQDTNTSAVDFENRQRTPGWIPGGR